MGEVTEENMVEVPSLSPSLFTIIKNEETCIGKVPPGNIHMEEDTGGIHELKICQTGTTHGTLGRHLELLITFIELGCDEVISWCVCTYTHITQSPTFVSLIVLAS